MSFGDVRSMELTSWQMLIVVVTVVLVTIAIMLKILTTAFSEVRKFMENRNGGKRMILAAAGAVIADDTYSTVLPPQDPTDSPTLIPQAVAPAQNVPETGGCWCWILCLACVVAFITGGFVLVMLSLTVCDVHFETTHVQTIMNVTVHRIQAQKEQTRKRVLHEKLCSKVGGDVLEQIEVLMQSGYNVSGIPSTLKSLEEERNSLLAERDALRKNLSIQENITAELQRANVTCHGNLNISMYQRERLVKEALNMSTQLKILNGTVKELEELKDHVAAITNAKNDCETNVTKVTLVLKNCKKARAEEEANCKKALADEEARVAQVGRKCWV